MYLVLIVQRMNVSHTHRIDCRVCLEGVAVLTGHILCGCAVGAAASTGRHLAFPALQELQADLMILMQRAPLRWLHEAFAEAMNGSAAVTAEQSSRRFAADGRGSGPVNLSTHG